VSTAKTSHIGGRHVKKIILFAVHVPDVHLTEFTDAVSHGEILLMVDVPSKRVTEIGGVVRRNYPEAVAGGVSLSVDAFGL
jgi:hypothetical protein